MKRQLFLAALMLFAIRTYGQSMNDLLREGQKIMGGSQSRQGENLSQGEVVNGLKEALRIGAQNAAGKLGKTDGFFRNQLIKIMMPQEVKHVETTLRSFGFAKQCDQVILSLNRAAEDASTRAVPIFVNAITSMNIQDGMQILRGGDNAATEYLRRTTTDELTRAFRPVIEQSLGRANATRYWADIFTIYNRLPNTRRKVNTDLTAYVTERALNGLFLTVSQEEAAIRQNPAARVTDLLRRVFGH